MERVGDGRDKEDEKDEETRGEGDGKDGSFLPSIRLTPESIPIPPILSVV
jgi:hypothetical protein